MSDVSRPDAKRFGWHGILAVLVVATLAAGSVLSRHRPDAERPAPAVVSARAPRVAVERCGECHWEIVERFPEAAHARTLHRATDPEILERFAGRAFERTDPHVEYRYRLTDGELVLSTDAYARELPIHWIFGSGTHAQTPLITWTDNDGNTAAIEHVVSWYPHGDLLGVTLGMEQLVAASGVHALGRPWPPAETINCFGCHSTYVPTNGQQIDFAHLQPGISCSRCHWDTQQHVEDMEEGRPLTIERFSEMSPREAIDRCGECHRRASEMGGEITPDNETLVRFAPVGLVQSPCFRQQDQVVLDSGEPGRMDCTTCHDPHRPAETRWQFYADICLKCHDAAHDRAADCSVATRQDNCLTCHMPKVPMNDNLSFTDHWIRVHQSGPAGGDGATDSADAR
jgi:hypothetical protein